MQPNSSRMIKLSRAYQVTLTKQPTLCSPQASRRGHPKRLLSLMHAGAHSQAYSGSRRSPPTCASLVTSMHGRDQNSTPFQASQLFTQQQSLPAPPSPFPQPAPPLAPLDGGSTSLGFETPLDATCSNSLHPNLTLLSSAPSDINDALTSLVQSFGLHDPGKGCIDPRAMSRVLPDHASDFPLTESFAYEQNPGSWKSQTRPASPIVWGMDHTHSMQQFSACATPSNLSSEEDDCAMSDAFSSDDTRGTQKAPYNQLLYRCLMQAQNREMSLKGIYSWFENCTDKAQLSKTHGWQNSIRHNLSMNPVSFAETHSRDKHDADQIIKAFQRGSRTNRDGGTANIWSLTDHAIQHGVEPTTRFRLQNRRGLKKRARHILSKRMREGGGSAASVASDPASLGGSPMLPVHSSPGAPSNRSHGEYSPNPAYLNMPPRQVNQHAQETHRTFSDQIIAGSDTATGSSAAPQRNDGYLDPRLQHASNIRLLGWPQGSIVKVEPETLTSHVLLQHEEANWPRDSQAQPVNHYPQDSSSMLEQESLPGQAFRRPIDVSDMSEPYVSGMHEEAKSEPLFTGGFLNTSLAGQGGAQTPGSLHRPFHASYATISDGNVLSFDYTEEMKRLSRLGMK